MYSTTARRMPQAQPFKLDPLNGVPVRFKDSQNMWPLNWQGEGWEWASLRSRLHIRAMDILRNDPTVTDVTVLEW